MNALQSITNIGNMNNMQNNSTHSMSQNSSIMYSDKKSKINNLGLINNPQRYTNIINNSSYHKSIQLDPHNVCKVNSSASKFTCKYEIHYGSQNSANGFQLAKRIIGPKGSNMKSIIEASFNGKRMIPDYLKLRLRGRGSGFKEGPMKRGEFLSR